MKVNLPYVFSLTGKLPGTRGMSHFIVGDHKEFEIGEIASADAPVCFSWSDAPGGHCGAYSVGNESTVEVRHAEGNFYRMLTIGAGFPDTQRRVTDLVRHPPIDYADNDERLKKAYMPFVLGHASCPRPSLTGDVISSEDEILARYLYKVENLVIIDGALWEKCPAPVLILEETVKTQPYWSINPAFPDRYKDGSQTTHFKFAIDETEMAVAFAHVRAVDCGIPEDLDGVGSVEVATPELVAHPYLADDIVNQANRFLHKVGNMTLIKASFEYAETFIEFRKAAEMAELTPEDDNVQILLDAWTAFASVRLAEINALEDSQQNTRTPTDRDFCSNIANSLYTRFSERTLDFNEIVQRSMSA